MTNTDDFWQQVKPWLIQELDGVIPRANIEQVDISELIDELQAAAIRVVARSMGMEA